MTRDVTQQTIGVNLDPHYRPYFRMGVDYAPEKTVRRILSGDLPKAYQNFSQERIDRLMVQAALSDQGYGHLLIGNKNSKYTGGLDGKFEKRSNEARQAWLACNPQWRDKSFREIDQEILHRSYKSLGISNAAHPDAGLEKDKYFLVQNSRVPQVRIKHERSNRVTILSYHGIYEVAFKEFKSGMAEARRLYKAGNQTESLQKYQSTARDFLEIALPLGRGLESEALMAQWKDKVINTVNVFNQWRTRPIAA